MPALKPLPRVALAALVALAAVVLFIVLPDLAAADVAPQPDGPIQVGVNIWLVLLGAATPALGYVLNHYAPWASEPVKQAVQVALAAGVACLYQMVSDGNFGWNKQTLIAVVTTVVTALAAHLGLYKPGHINAALGGGTNHQAG